MVQVLIWHRTGVQDARAFNNPAQAERSVGLGDILLNMRASGTRPLTEPEIVWMQLMYVVMCRYTNCLPYKEIAPSIRAAVTRASNSPLRYRKSHRLFLHSETHVYYSGLPHTAPYRACAGLLRVSPAGAVKTRQT